MKFDASIDGVRRKTVRNRSAMSLEALERRLAPAGGLMQLMVPDFRVTEDAATRLTFRPVVGADSHTRLSLTLEVNAGELRAFSTPRVEVGGNESSTVKTFSGTADALNRYFARGKVTYVTPQDGNGPYRLTATSGCDCTVYPPAPCCGHPEAEEPADAGIIRVRPVNDRPTVASRATLPIVAGATSKTMTYDDLKLDDGEILTCLEAARELGAMAMIHAENADAIAYLTQRLTEQGKTAPRFHGMSRPMPVEREATHRAITLSELVESKGIEVGWWHGTPDEGGDGLGVGPLLAIVGAIVFFGSLL